MILYAVIWKDRHTDSSAHLFTDKDAAIAWAKAQADENNTSNYQEEWQSEGSDWLAYFPYNCEGDNLHVVEVEVDAELAD